MNYGQIWRQQQRIDAMVQDMRAVCAFDRLMRDTKGAVLQHGARTDPALMRAAKLWAAASD